jgi:hypothetical protein
MLGIEPRTFRTQTENYTIKLHPLPGSYEPLFRPYQASIIVQYLLGVGIEPTRISPRELKSLALTTRPSQLVDFSTIYIQEPFFKPFLGYTSHHRIIIYNIIFFFFFYFYKYIHYYN